MPFAYFERLTRRQQAIYLQSDAIATLPLRHPERLRPLVTELGRALDSGDRRLTDPRPRSWRRRSLGRWGCRPSA